MTPEAALLVVVVNHHKGAFRERRAVVGFQPIKRSRNDLLVPIDGGPTRCQGIDDDQHWLQLLDLGSKPLNVAQPEIVEDVEPGSVLYPLCFELFFECFE